MKRKIIQIFLCPETDYEQRRLMALCDDGTVWYLQNNKWRLIPEQIPQHDLPQA